MKDLNIKRNIRIILNKNQFNKTHLTTDIVSEELLKTMFYYNNCLKT